MASRSRRWTVEQQAELARLLERGLSYAEIAKALGRPTGDAVRKQAADLGLAVRPAECRCGAAIDQLFRGRPKKWCSAACQLRTTYERKPRVLAPIKHGTPTGARVHRGRGEKTCDECRLAENADKRERWRKSRSTESS